MGYAARLNELLTENNSSFGQPREKKTLELWKKKYFGLNKDRY